MKDKKNKENKTPRCPGCSKHCTAANVRCKYGEKYFARLASAAPKAADSKAKWEKHVTPGTWLHAFIAAGRSLRKTLKKGKAREGDVISAITAEEAAILAAILKKLEKFRNDD